MKKDRTEQRTERFYKLLNGTENREELKTVYNWFLEAFTSGKITGKQYQLLRIRWYERIEELLPIKK